MGQMDKLLELRSHFFCFSSHGSFSLDLGVLPQIVLINHNPYTMARIKCRLGVEVDKTCWNSTHPVHENAVGCFAVLMSILQLGCHTRKNIPFGPLHRHTHTH